jgi:hypothetical protein
MPVESSTRPLMIRAQEVAQVRGQAADVEGQVVADAPHRPVIPAPAGHAPTENLHLEGLQDHDRGPLGHQAGQTEASCHPPPELGFEQERLLRGKSQLHRPIQVQVVRFEPDEAQRGSRGERRTKATSGVHVHNGSIPSLVLHLAREELAVSVTERLHPWVVVRQAERDHSDLLVLGRARGQSHAALDPRRPIQVDRRCPRGGRCQVGPALGETQDRLDEGLDRASGATWQGGGRFLGAACCARLLEPARTPQRGPAADGEDEQ